DLGSKDGKTTHRRSDLGSLHALPSLLSIAVPRLLYCHKRSSALRRHRSTVATKRIGANCSMILSERKPRLSQRFTVAGATGAVPGAAEHPVGKRAEGEECRRWVARSLRWRPHQSWGGRRCIVRGSSKRSVVRSQHGRCRGHARASLRPTASRAVWGEAT